MATRVRSYSKINLGLAIGPVRADGFHGLATLYQTLALHDFVTVSARRLDGAADSRISLTTNHSRVPVDARNTCWKMVEWVLARMGVAAEVAIHIEKRLPVQGGMGAGSANAAAALLGLERELGLALPGAERLRLAGEVGSDVPLFLLGGTVLGRGRGELVFPMPDFARTWCVVAVPEVGVSTPQAFRDWDALTSGAKAPSSGTPYGTAEAVPLTNRAPDALVQGEGASGAKAPSASGTIGTAKAVPLTKPSPDAVELRSAVARPSPDSTTMDSEAARVAGDRSQISGVGSLAGGLTSVSGAGRLDVLSLAYSSLSAKTGDGRRGTSGIVLDQMTDLNQDATNDLAEDALLALVRTGIGNQGLHNDFEDVVFPQYPSLRSIKRQLMGSDSDRPAIYAALSGSGSALFGLYRSEAEAKGAQRRVQESGCRALLTSTLPREDYWREMFAE